MTIRLVVPALLFVACGTPMAATACYTVYDQHDRIVYQGVKSPVDMSKPLHETVPGLFPGGHMVFDNVTQNCGEAGSLAQAAPAPVEPDTTRMGAAGTPAAPQAPRDRVITELKNPPLRVWRDEKGQLVFDSLDD